MDGLDRWGPCRTNTIVIFYLSEVATAADICGHALLNTLQHPDDGDDIDERR